MRDDGHATATPRRVAILGVTGYTGQELLRLVALHPHLQLVHAMTARADHAPAPPALPCDPVVERLDLEALRGVDGVFLEVHENPPAARSDAQNALRLADLAPLLDRLTAINTIVKAVPAGRTS